MKSIILNNPVYYKTNLDFPAIENILMSIFIFQFVLKKNSTIFFRSRVMQYCFPWNVKLAQDFFLNGMNEIFHRSFLNFFQFVLSDSIKNLFQYTEWIKKVHLKCNRKYYDYHKFLLRWEVRRVWILKYILGNRN